MNNASRGARVIAPKSGKRGSDFWRDSSSSHVPVVVRGSVQDEFQSHSLPESASSTGVHGVVIHEHVASAFRELERQPMSLDTLAEPRLQRQPMSVDTVPINSQASLEVLKFLPEDMVPIPEEDQ